MLASFRELTDGGQKIVSVVNYKDAILIATEHNIYSVKDGKIKLMIFEFVEKQK